MTYTRTKILGAVFFVGLSWPGLAQQNQAQPNKAETNAPQKSAPDKPAAPSAIQPPIATPPPKQPSEPPTDAGKSDPMKPTDWLMVGLTAIYVGISFFGLRAIKRQTDVASAAAEAAKLNAQAVINAERPFILVESRGDRGTEFWIKNCGKSPAQMLHIDPIPKMAWPKFDAAEQEWEMPVPPNYGNAHESGEQFNVAWLAPGEERCFHSFDPSIFKEFAGTLRAELNQGLRRFYLYHGIKYRGIITKDVFETRYCYAWGARGFYMAGPYGYNKNT